MSSAKSVTSTAASFFEHPLLQEFVRLDPRIKLRGNLPAPNKALARAERRELEGHQLLTLRFTADDLGRLACGTRKLAADGPQIAHIGAMVMMHLTNATPEHRTGGMPLIFAKDGNIMIGARGVGEGGEYLKAALELHFVVPALKARDFSDVIFRYTLPIKRINQMIGYIEREGLRLGFQAARQHYHLFSAEERGFAPAQPFAPWQLCQQMPGLRQALKSSLGIEIPSGAEVGRQVPRLSERAGAINIYLDLAKARNIAESEAQRARLEKEFALDASIGSSFIKRTSGRFGEEMIHVHLAINGDYGTEEYDKKRSLALETLFTVLERHKKLFRLSYQS